MNSFGHSAFGREVIGIQYLRGLAAMMVVAFHLGYELTRMGYGGPWPWGLASGVDVFFVLSGFIMWLTTRNGGTSPVTFLKRRILRIVPLYWAFTTLLVVILLAMPRVAETTVLDPLHVLASYVFVPALNRSTGELEPVLQPGWTLNCEMLFYLAFAVVLSLPRPIRFWTLALLFAGLAALGAIAGFPAASLKAFYTSSVLVEFVGGMALARVATESGVLRRLTPGPAWVLCLVGLAGLLISPEILPPNLPDRMGLAVSATLMIAGILGLEAHDALPRLKFLQLLGDASYSIYLSQVLVLAATCQIWRRLHLDTVTGGWVGFVLVGLGASGLGGIVIYWFVERPLNAAFRAQATSRRSSVRPLAAPVG